MVMDRAMVRDTAMVTGLTMAGLPILTDAVWVATMEGPAVTLGAAAGGAMVGAVAAGGADMPDVISAHPSLA